jgi:integrase/recombinase XerD
MQLSRAIAIWLEYHKSHSRENTLKAYQAALDTFPAEFGDRKISEISPEEILLFLNRVTEGEKPQTRRTRYAHLAAFFNFIRNNFDSDFRNPCDTPPMKRLFRNRAPARWNTIDKDTMDEVIFKTVKSRNRLMLELMARGGMRIGEVLKLTPNDINERS